MWIKHWKAMTAVAMACATCAAGSALYAHSKGRQSGMQQTQALWDSEKLLQAQKQAEVVQALNQKVYEAQVHAKDREVVLARDVADARRTVAGLREQLAQADLRIGTASTSSVAEYASTVNELLGDCAAAYRDVAEKADGHANDAVMLYEAWPGRNQ